MTIPTGGLPILGTLYPAGALPIVDGQGTRAPNFGNPTSAQDLATKSYVDSSSGGAPFFATYYVSPTFSGTSNGSQSAPYTSITAVLAVAPSTGALIILAPLANTTENVVFPSTGDWEVKCDQLDRATITGNVTCTTGSLTLTNVLVTGNVAGNATNSSVGNNFVLNNTLVNGTVTLSATGSAFWFARASGTGYFFGFGGFVAGAFSVVGSLQANNYLFESAIAASSVNTMVLCHLQGNITLTGSGPSNPVLTMVGCSLDTITITGTGVTRILVDGFTASWAPTLVNAVLVIKEVESPFSATLYVDPTYTGISTGSAANPYTSITSAIAAAPATGAVIVLGTKANITENVTFPNSGAWEIMCESLSLRTAITGTITIPTTTSTSSTYRLTGLTVNGNITGDCGTSSSGILVLTHANIQGSITLTNSAGSGWSLIVRGIGPAQLNFGTIITGTSSVVGSIKARNAELAALSFTVASELYGCLTTAAGIALGSGSLTVGDTIFGVAPTFTGPGSVVTDGFSHATLGAYTLASGATLTLRNDTNPLKATYYVDPTFTGVSTGSAANPYTSITAALAVAPSTGALIILAPESSTTENVTLPTTGRWEIKCDDGNSATITGNLVCTSTVQCTYRLTNIHVTGTVTGTATSSSGNLFYATNCHLDGAVTLAGTGSGAWFALFNGVGATFFGLNGIANGNVSVFGQLLAYQMFFGGTLSFGGPSELRGCRISSSSLTFLANAGLNIFDTVFTVTPTFTGPGSVIVDGYSYVAAAGLVLAGGATLSIRNSFFPITLTYVVDAAAASGGNGSDAAPFQTIQQAITAAGAGNATIRVAPGTYATNLTFPAAQEFNIQAYSPRFALPVTISGTISIPVSTSTQWVDVGITGNVTGTGSAGGGAYFVLYRSYMSGTFTATSGGFLNLVAISDLNIVGNTYNQAWVAGAVNTLGACLLEKARVDVALTCQIIHASGTEFTSTHTITTNSPTANAAFFGDGCTFTSGWTYTGTSGQNLTIADPTTAANYAAATPTLTNTTNIVYGFAVPPSTIIGGLLAVTSSAPQDVTKATAAVGTAIDAARSDHKHNVSTAATVAVGAANAEGTATSLARSDHTHQVTDLHFASQAQGDLAYFNGTNWVRLAAGTSGQWLKTQGASANPTWATIAFSPSGAVSGDTFVFNGTNLVPSTTYGTGSGYQKQFIWDADDDAGALLFLYDFRDEGISILRLNANPLCITVANSVNLHSTSGSPCLVNSDNDVRVLAGSNSSAGHLAELGGGDSSTGVGGTAWVHPGNGSSGTQGNIVLGPTTIFDFKSMQGGMAITQGAAIPIANPPTGVFFAYIDPADGKLKLRGSSGTITILAVP